MDSDVSSLYKAKTWEKEEDGKTIIDGFAYRGKRSFGKALEGLKETMQKGVKSNINGIDFKVLDARKKGVEIEIEIEMNEKNKKGVALLKLYGPNKRKEYAITVSRCKGSEAIFVVILNKKIVKPLMVDILKGETTPKLLEQNRIWLNVHIVIKLLTLSLG